MNVTSPLTGSPVPCLPDYAGASIVNLMADIAGALGAHDWRNPGLSDRNVRKALEQRGRIVLIVIDGLGKRYLANHPGARTLKQFTCAGLTSVFPSTTATAVTTLLTGLAPAEHGLTGWHMWFPELATTGAVLPLRQRDPDRPLTALGLDTTELFGHRSLFECLPVQSFALAPERIVDSDYNRIHTRGARRYGYASIERVFVTILNCLRVAGERCYVHAYYPDFDSIAHEHGVASSTAQGVLTRFDNAFAQFLSAARALDASVLVCADHGFIDSPVERAIQLDRHPVLADCLRLPLCGERRAAYCYVRPGKEETFEEYVNAELSEQVWLHRSRELIEQGWFGSSQTGSRLHPKLNHRVGDYTLVMKDNWVVKDWLPGEKRHHLIGVHGGVTSDEMMVPLILVQP